MPPRDGKRRILARLSGLGYVTDSALSKILGVLNEEGVLASDLGGTSRTSLSRAPLQQLEAPTIYWPVLQQLQLPLSAGGFYPWWHVNPFAVLNFLARQEPKFGHVLYEASQRNPSTPQNPWHIAWYLDEACPGNLLSMDLGRKCDLVYWSFRELGTERLARESNWMLGGVLKSTVCSKLRSRAATLFRYFLLVMFGQEHNFLTSGCTVHTATGVVTICAKLDAVIGDEDALRAVWGGERCIRT